MEPNLYLVASSLSLLFPSLLCYTLDLPLHAGIYGLVACTSSAYHATKYPGLLWIDLPLNQIGHIVTVSYIIKGGWVSMPTYFVWLVYTVVTYYGGYRTSTLIWNPDYARATPWHVVMHLSTSACTLYTVFVTWAKLKDKS